MTFEEYDERYPLVFDRLVEEVDAVCPGSRVEHVGSTAVPGLGGRGTIDAVLFASESSRVSIVDALLMGGFARAPFEWIDATLVREIELAGRCYPVLLYVLAEGHEVARGWVAMREYLLTHPHEAQRYAAVKREAVAAGHVHPSTYQQAKTPYLQKLAQQLSGSDSWHRTPMREPGSR